MTCVDRHGREILIESCKNTLSGELESFDQGRKHERRRSMQQWRLMTGSSLSKPIFSINVVISSQGEKMMFFTSITIKVYSTDYIMSWQILSLRHRSESKGPEESKEHPIESFPIRELRVNAFIGVSSRLSKASRKNRKTAAVMSLILFFFFFFHFFFW